MPESPWERAEQQNEEALSNQDRAEQLQHNAESMGLAGAVGFMAMATVAPMAAKRGAKMAVKAAGKRAARSKTYKKTTERAQEYARKAGASTGSVDKKYMDRAVKDVSSIRDRSKIAAARQYESSGGTDLTQFLGDVGFKGPTRLRERASAYREFKQSKAAQEKGTMRALSEVGSQDAQSQRKLLGSAMSHFGAEQAVVFPTTYALDSALGVTEASWIQRLSGPVGDGQEKTEGRWGVRLDFKHLCSTFFTVVMGACAFRNDSELSFHRVVYKDYHHLFPDLISRSRYHRRRKALMGIQREMLRFLMNRLRLLAMWLALDSAPITTAKSPRWKSAQLSIWAAEAGFAPSKRQVFPWVSSAPSRIEYRG